MPKERNKADSYREKAYEGDTKAMNNLGVCYERGTGVKVNLEMAFEWYMKAAELGDVYGCFNVGECCTNFHCGEKAKALRLPLITNILHYFSFY